MAQNHILLKVSHHTSCDYDYHCNKLIWLIMVLIPMRTNAYLNVKLKVQGPKLSKIKDCNLKIQSVELEIEENENVTCYYNDL